MAKRKFDNLVRSALWTTYKNTCFYCNRPLDWEDLHIDHIIPESISKKIEEFVKIKKKFELNEEFSLNDLNNLVPSHSKCNYRKSDNLFNKSTTLFYLSITSQKVSKIEMEIERLRKNKSKGQILAKLQCAIFENTLCVTELKKLLIEIEKKAWDIKEITLPIGIHFIDEVYDVFYLNSDFSKLRNKKLLLGNDEQFLELINDREEKINVSTLNEWKDAVKNNFYPFSTYATKTSATFTFFEELIHALRNAKMPKISFINDPWIEVDMLEFLSPNVIVDFEGKLKEYITMGLSIKDLVDMGIVKVNSSSNFKISLEFEGIETSLMEQFRADFNSDGVEKIFARGWVRATTGTLGFGFTTILTKLSEKHLIEQVDYKEFI